MVENVFKNRNFRLTFFGALVSNIGATFYSFATSFFILVLTNNNSFIQGIYLAVCGVVFGITSLFGGVLSDRFNKAKIMYICDYLKAIIIAIPAIFLFFNFDNTFILTLLFISGVLGNIVSAIFSPASASLLPMIIEEDQLQQGNAYFSILNSLQAIFGIVLAGILYSLLPIKFLFIVIASCYALSGLSEMFIKYEFVRSEVKLTVKQTFTDIKDGAKYMFTSNILMALISTIIFINFFFSPVESNFISYFIETDVATSSYLFDNIFKPEMWSSIISVCFGVSSLIAAFIISKKRQEESVARKLKFWLSVLPVVLILDTICYYFFVEKNPMLNYFLVSFCTLYFVIGISLTNFNIRITTKMLTIVDKDNLGKVNSLMSIGTQGLIPLASFLAGIVLRDLGSFYLLLICSIGLVIPVLLFVLNKHINEL